MPIPFLLLILKKGKLSTNFFNYNICPEFNIADAMQLKNIFSFAEDLLSKGRKNKYVADQVCSIHYNQPCLFFNFRHFALLPLDGFSLITMIGAHLSPQGGAKTSVLWHQA